LYYFDKKNMNDEFIVTYPMLFYKYYKNNCVILTNIYIM
jgi:hypothetical protein